MHLWLNLSVIKEKDKSFLLNTPILPSGLFGTSVETVVERFKEARKQEISERCISLQEIYPL